MRFLIFILLALSAGFGLTMLADNPGYVLISRQPWSVETTLVVFILALLAAFVIFYLLLRLLDKMLTTPAKLRKWQARRNRDQAAEETRKGITEMILGHWPQAEKLLTRRLADSTQPELNLLGSAWLAQQQGDSKKRDRQLSEAAAFAASVSENSVTAVGIVHCKLLEQAGENEQALVAARELYQQTPANPAVIRAISGLLKAEGQWQELITVLTTSNRAHAFADDELAELQSLAACQLLESDNNDASLESSWKALPKQLRKQAEIIAAYCRALSSSGRDDEAEKLIRTSLKREWSDTLINIYGQLKTSNPCAQVKVAESWLPDHPTETPMMLCVGRLALKSQLWGMARNFLEIAVQNGDSNEAALELGWLFESLGELDEAREAFKAGLEDSLGHLSQGFTAPGQLRIDASEIDTPDSQESESDDSQSSALAYSNESK